MNRKINKLKKKSQGKNTIKSRCRDVHSLIHRKAIKHKIGNYNTDARDIKHGLMILGDIRHIKI